jgi:hypothetical protein
VIAALLIVTAFGPEFWMLTVKVLLLPEATDPKARVELLAERTLPCCCWLEEPPLLNPWQPVKTASEAASRIVAAFATRCLPGGRLIRIVSWVWQIPGRYPRYMPEGPGVVWIYTKYAPVLHFGVFEGSLSGFSNDGFVENEGLISEI